MKIAVLGAIALLLAALSGIAATQSQEFSDLAALTNTVQSSPVTLPADSSKPAQPPVGAIAGPIVVSPVAGVAALSSNPTPSAANSYVADDKYKLRAGDKLSFQILEDRYLDEKDAPKGLVVADSGEIDVPYIGRVAAIDKTCKQLAGEIKTRLETDYYNRATVVLALEQANKYVGRIYVWGQVRNQGAIDIAITENITAGKAILRAGGFADFANKKKVKVVRAATANGTPGQTIELNMVEILEQGKTDKDVPLQPDDFVIVPSRLINF